MTILMAAASGGPFEKITLTGTVGSPETVADPQESPTNSSCGWRFDTDGNIYRAVGGVWTQFAEWVSNPPANITWRVRFQQQAGDAPTSGTPLGIFYRLDFGVEREFTFSQAGVGATDGTIKVDISNTADASGIVATGYYRGNAVVTSPA